MTGTIVLLAGHMTSLERIRRVSGYVSLAAWITAFVPAPARAQSASESPPPVASEPAVVTLNTDRLPIDIYKIQRALAKPPSNQARNAAIGFPHRDIRTATHH